MDRGVRVGEGSGLSAAIDTPPESLSYGDWCHASGRMILVYWRDLVFSESNEQNGTAKLNAEV